MIEARFRRRAHAREEAGKLLDGVLDVIDRFSYLWRQPGARQSVELDRGTGESAACDLTPWLVPDVQGALGFASRMSGAIDDDASCDDTLILRFVADEYDFPLFVDEVFPELVKGFSCYRASLVTDTKIAIEDYAELINDASKTDREKDHRFVVSRFYPVDYFDELLCKRAFGLSAKALVKRLKPICERAELIDSGAFLIFTYEILTGDDLRSLDTKARSQLGGS